MRQANIEILRALLMFFVVGCHVLNLGANAYPPLLTSGVNYYFTAFFDSFFMLAVDCFVIISGFFGIKLKVKKTVSLVLPVYFYSFLFGGLGSLLGYGSFSSSNLFPILNNSYWFLTSYLLLCLFSPILNSFVENSSKSFFLKVLCVFYVLFSIIPSFSFFSLTHDDGFGIINFILLYLTGRFIAQVKSHLLQSWQMWFVFNLLAVFIIFSENVLVNLIIGYNKGYQGLFWHYDNIFIIWGSIALFITFLNVKIENLIISKAICWLSPSFFYIYIIHCTHPLGSLFFKFVDESWFLNTDIFPLYVVSLTLSIFIICLITDVVLRRVVFRKLLAIIETLILKSYSRIEYILVNKNR